jgi:hypothetical protein
MEEILNHLDYAIVILLAILAYRFLGAPLARKV